MIAGNRRIKVNDDCNKDVNLDIYHQVRSGRIGAFEQKRGLVAVWGKEAVQFLDGLVTNSVKGMADADQILAAFPDAKGRLLAVVRVLRQGDRYLFETEEATRGVVYQNLFRFTFAGDFFVEDLSDAFTYIGIFGRGDKPGDRDIVQQFESSLAFELPYGAGYFIPQDRAPGFRDLLAAIGCDELDDELYEVLRIEEGIPRYGIDMDETTVVPELGLPDLISYNKGCYIGQEIIARIHFRGHVAKQLTGLVFDGSRSEGDWPENTEVSTPDGKPAGKLTSVAYSPQLQRTIALAYIRYDYLAPGTGLQVGDPAATVTGLPFIK